MELYEDNQELLSSFNGRTETRYTVWSKLCGKLLELHNYMLINFASIPDLAVAIAT